ncbi:MAG: hypothetical protein ACKPE3_14115 [Sphaerospermopsis kisseleviana]
MRISDLNVGDTILAKKVRRVSGDFYSDNYIATVVEKGRKYIYFQVHGVKIKREKNDLLPSGLVDHYVHDYYLFKDESQFAEYQKAREARSKLSQYFSTINAVGKLSDQQVEQISRIIGL